MKNIYNPTEHNSYDRLVQTHFDDAVNFDKLRREYTQLARSSKDKVERERFFALAIEYNNRQVRSSFRYSFGFDCYLNIIYNVN